MTDHELLLIDRLSVIKTADIKYDLNSNAYLSFSGGKDSTLLHYLLDEALPNNRIPRVYIDTGIEYQLIREFVYNMAKNDDRFVIIKPTLPIKATLEKYGYPFKSKEHSFKLHEWQLGNRETNFIKKYLGNGDYSCPKKLKYQFSDDFKINVSHMCCVKLKKQPIKKWMKENDKAISITGMRREEGGQRATLKCILTDKKGNIEKFHPLAVVNDDWEDWYIKERNIRLCELYYPPYNFIRTGCKGCPFNLNLQKDLDTMAELLPNERKACEVIWKPVYEEYRRIGYRLRKKDKQMTIFDRE